MYLLQNFNGMLNFKTAANTILDFVKNVKLFSRG